MIDIICTAPELPVLVERLAEVENVFKRKVIAKGLRAATKLLHSAALANAPRKSGRTAKALRVRAGKRKNGYVSMQLVLGKQFFTGPTWYSAFDLFGHRIGSRKLGNKRKKYPGDNWLLHTWDEMGETAVRRIIDVCNQLLDHALAGGKPKE